MQLKAAMCNEDDSAQGIARMERATMRNLGIAPGDYLELMGNSPTYLTVLAGENLGPETVAVDQVTLRNLGIANGSSVECRKIGSIRRCNKATIAPREKADYSRINLAKLIKGFAIFKRNAISCRIGSNTHVFDVLSTDPEEPCVITESTQINIKSRKRNNFEGVLYDDIGGLKNEIDSIRDIIELQLMHPEIYSRLGVKATKGALLYGPPGTGKTLIAKAIATETDAYFISINAPEMMSKFLGESEENLRKVFLLAKENSPSIIFIDEIDAIAPKRDDGSEAERRVVAQLLTLMDGLEENIGIVVVGATNRRESIDEALRRPGRFDKEIEVSVPDELARLEILEIHTRKMPLSENVSLEKLAKLTYGFTGADIEALCKESAMRCLKRVSGKERVIGKSILDSLTVTNEDFMDALRSVEPSALREVVQELPKASWDDIAGLEEIIAEIKETIELRLFNTEQLQERGIEVPRGILLKGPSGTGKTLVARAIASNTQANFIYISSPTILSKYVGESEKVIRQVFTKARNAAPCIIFFDSIEALCSKEKTIAQQVSQEIDNLPERVVVIAATSNIEAVDRSLLSQGKLEKVLELKQPDTEQRRKIFEVYLRKMKAHEIDSWGLGEATGGWNGAMIKALCMKAGIRSVKRNSQLVEQEDFDHVIGNLGQAVARENYQNLADSNGNTNSMQDAMDLMSGIGVQEESQGQSQQEEPILQEQAEQERSIQPMENGPVKDQGPGAMADAFSTFTNIVPDLNSSGSEPKKNVPEIAKETNEKEKKSSYDFAIFEDIESI